MSLEAYLQELKDPAQPLVASKLTSISGLDPDELSTFLGTWLETDVERRRQVVRQLLELTEDNVELNFDAVFVAGLEDEDAEVRHMAVQGLWEYDGRDLISPLVRLLGGDPDAGVRAEAALALGVFMLRAELEQLSADDGQRVEQALHAVIDNPTETVEVRARALESVGACSAPWVRNSIDEAYGSGDRRLQVSAVHAMGRSCDSRWLPILFRELASGDAEMRYEAASACASLGDESAVPHLLPLLDDDDREVQEVAIAALGEIGGAEAKTALEELRDHPEARVREAVLNALEELDFEEDPLRFRYR